MYVYPAQNFLLDTHSRPRLGDGPEIGAHSRREEMLHSFLCWPPERARLTLLFRGHLAFSGVMEL